MLPMCIIRTPPILPIPFIVCAGIDPGGEPAASDAEQGERYTAISAISYVTACARLRAGRAGVGGASASHLELPAPHPSSNPSGASSTRGTSAASRAALALA